MYNFHKPEDLDFLERTTIDEPTVDGDGDGDLDEDEEDLDKVDDSLDAGLDE